MEPSQSHSAGEARFYAHTDDSADEAGWEPLEVHLEEVARQAASCASAFDSREWGRLAGLWHDLGKYHPRFQARLRDDSIRQSHSGAGAVLAMERFKQAGQFLATIIAGHHAGLCNIKDDCRLSFRLEDAAKVEWPGVEGNAPAELLEEKMPAFPAWMRDPLQAEMWTRLLFSALVDADRLCTERFHQRDRPVIRKGSQVSLQELRDRLEAYLTALSNNLDEEARRRPVNLIRARISSACLDAAKLAPGLFSLTVPTGGGKTLAGMRFALHHATQHGQQRVIVVIPYTSIIEQNAREYAKIFGANNVLEHHSNLDVERRRKDHGEAVSDWQDLAAENWDAPVVVTTTVQFFESLFTNHPSRARKLHNIVNSVVILDEVQSLPPEFLRTILDGLKQLTTHYRCTVVLSTATPPALKKRPSMEYGLERVREIVTDPTALAATLRRVTYTWCDPDGPAMEWPALAAELAQHDQVLAVVHRRDDARTLAELLMQQVAEDSVLHLSALMCPAHRVEVLAEVKRRLGANEPCRLISTQLIEAGVDVDFPVVYRALGGLDSVVQAAGRCNREGKRATGRVVVFMAPSNPPPGVPRKGMRATEVMLRADPSLQADDPQVQEEFFRRLYYMSDEDIRGVQQERNAWNFANVAEKFRLIEDGFTSPIVVPWGDSDHLVRELRQASRFGSTDLRDKFRALQPLTVSVYTKAFDQALCAGALIEACEGLHYLSPAHAQHYHKVFGLVIGDDIGVMSPESTIIGR